MQVNGTAVAVRQDRPVDGLAGGAVVSPVLGAPVWFPPAEQVAAEQGGGVGTLRLHIALSQAEMVAALYDPFAGLRADDLSSAEQVWGAVAVALYVGGIDALQLLAADIERQEAAGELVSPEWLGFCRARVAAVLIPAPAMWPDGEPAEVRDAYDEHAGKDTPSEPAQLVSGGGVMRTVSGFMQLDDYGQPCGPSWGASPRTGGKRPGVASSVFVRLHMFRSTGCHDDLAGGVR